MNKKNTKDVIPDGTWRPYPPAEITEELERTEFELAAVWWEKIDKANRKSLGLYHFENLEKSHGLFRIAQTYYAGLGEERRLIWAAEFKETVLSKLKEIRTLLWLENKNLEEISGHPNAMSRIIERENEQIEVDGLAAHLEAAKLLRQAAKLIGIPSEFWLSRSPSASEIASMTTRSGTYKSIRQPPIVTAPKDVIDAYQETSENYENRCRMIEAIQQDDAMREISDFGSKRGKYSIENHATRMFWQCLISHRTDLRLSKYSSKPWQDISEVLELVNIDTDPSSVGRAVRNMQTE